MPVFTVPIHEYNDCHEPAGSPIGGQFCSEPGSGAAGRDAKAAYRSLRNEWARINNALLEHLDDPESNHAQALAQRQKEIVKEIYRLDVDRSVLDTQLPGGARDVVIVGAGPGGLSAAINAGAEGLDVVYIEAQSTAGGQPKFTSRVENYPGFEIGQSGAVLIEDMMEQAHRAGAEGLTGVRVTGMLVDEKTGLKTLSLSNGRTIETRAVILAMGVDANRISFPGSDSPDVFYQGQSPPEDVAGKSVVVVGGGNAAAQAALGAARKAEKVYLLARSGIEKDMSAYQQGQVRNHPRIEVLQDQLVSLETTTAGRAQAVVTKAGRRLPAASLGLFIGGKSDVKWLPGSIKTTNGKINVDSGLRTSVPGVYAIGDARVGSGNRIVTAAGDGALAVKDVFSYFDTLFSKPN